MTSEETQGKPSPTQLASFRWQKGKSANPRGRPKHSLTVSITAALKAYLIKHPDELHKIVIAWVKMATTGNAMALNEMLNRLEGKVTERHELEAKLPVTLVFQPVQSLTPAIQADDVIEGQVVVPELGTGSEE